jgi:hypothetical protein
MLVTTEICLGMVVILSLFYGEIVLLHRKG